MNVTACVSPSTGRVIMFHVNKAGGKGPKWNGEMAKTMYQGPLKSALARTYGEQQEYRVVEDGDPTGYQSRKGKAGKREAGIRSWQLPPRTPEWNPLDYSIWAQMEKNAIAALKGGTTPKRWAEKVRSAAHNLSPAYIKRTCAAMKKRILATKKAKGSHIKED